LPCRSALKKSIEGLAGLPAMAAPF
jgi:hypothetical protein